MADESRHALLKTWVDQAETASIDARTASELDRDYYDGNQWTEAEKAKLRKRKQPIVTDNVIKPAIDHFLGLEVQRRTDPRALPRTPNSEHDAEAATDAIRFVEERADFDRTASRVWANEIVEGIGGCDVCVEQEEDGSYEIVIRQIAWDRLGYDPASSNPDFSDARYLYTITWMDYDEAAAQWPDAKDILDETLGADPGNTYDDKPKNTAWRDSSRRRVKICEMYYKWPENGRDQWFRSLFTGSGEIEGGRSAYKDEDGDADCPLIFVSAFVDRDNNRYGMVRNLTSPQDEINKRRSKLLDMLSRRQVKATKGAVDDVRKAKQELASPDGWLEVNPGQEADLLQNVDHAQGHFELLADSRASINRLGPSAMERGKADGQASGRAIMASQQGGLVELAPLFDNHSHFKRRVYRAIWNRIRQYWTAERWVRVTDDQENVKFVGLNQQTTFGEAAMARLQKAGMTPDQAQQAIAQHPMSGMPYVQNNVAELDVDIILDEAPDTVTIQYEQFQMLTDLANAGIMFPPEVYIEAAPALRNKQKLLDILKGQQDPQAAQQQAMIKQKAIMQELQLKDAEIANKQADTFKTMQEGQKVRAEIGSVGMGTVKQAVDAAATVHQIHNPPQPAAQ